MSNKNPSFTTSLALGEAPPRPGQQVSARKPRVIVTGGSGKLGRSVVREVSFLAIVVLGDCERALLSTFACSLQRMGGT